MIAKLRTGSRNPFKAEAGSRPLLAGREDETGLLAEMLDLLCREREKWRGPLASDPFPPIKIIGPRGVGKTTLLQWIKRQAGEHGVQCVSCGNLKPDRASLSMHKILADISIYRRAIYWIRGIRFNAQDLSAGVELNKASADFTGVAGFAVRRRPLLLLMDEVHHYDLSLLQEVLQGSQQLISDGYPLGLVLAGTPGLDSHLAKAEATFITRSKHIYINTLSDAATRAALQKPFEQEKIAVAPEALEAMVAQTDNYPFFIQLVGLEVWKEMERSGRKEVDVEMVGRIEEQARLGRRVIYTQAYERLDDNDLLPYAFQVMELLDGKGGKVPAEAVIKLLMEANPDVDRKRAREIRNGLREDGFIWTVDDETAPGIPSFFSYCRDKQQENKAS